MAEVLGWSDEQKQAEWTRFQAIARSSTHIVHADSQSPAQAADAA
jgi:hypothetical protein